MESGPTGPAPIIEPFTLAMIPERYASPDPSTLAKLPRGIGNKNDRTRGKCDVCNGYHELPAIHLDYQGHADLTLDLIKVDPLWSWEPAAIDDDTGGPRIYVNGSNFVMWGYVTVLGKRILGVGTAPTNKDEPEKELIGDLLRNVGIRFGFATRLWSKHERDSKTQDDGEQSGGRRRSSSRSNSQAEGGTKSDAPASSSQLTLIGKLLDELGVAGDLDRDAAIGRLADGAARATLTRSAAITLIGILQTAKADGTSSIKVRDTQVELTGALADAVKAVTS